MNPELTKKAIQQIESLCEQGCTEINQILEKAHNGEDVEQLSDFDKTEVQQIIDELDQIMSVYNKQESGTDGDDS